MANRLAVPNVATLADIKSYLAITGTDQDSGINLYLPIVTRDIVEITNQPWVIERHCSIENTNLTEISTSNLDIGQVLQADIATTIATIDDENNAITVADSLATDSEATVWINATPLQLRMTAAKMVAYHIKTNSFDSNKLLQGGVTSESIGSYSYTLADGDSGTGSGYPNVIIKELRKFAKPRFY